MYPLDRNRAAAPNLLRTAAILAVLIPLHQLAWLGFLERIPPTPLALFPYVGLDLFFSILIAWLLIIVQKLNKLSIFISVAAPILLLSISSAKQMVLGDQAYFGDIFLFSDMVRAIPFWSAVAICAFLIVFTFLILFNLRPMSSFVAILVVAGCGSVVHANAERFTQVAVDVVNATYARTGDFPICGHFFGALAALAEDAEQRHQDRNLGSAGQDHRGVALPDVPVVLARDVHIIVLESFADPQISAHAHFSPDPFPSLFANWRALGAGHSLAPVYGGRSSNTEFEVLCGLPAFAGRSRVVTMRIPAGAALPCLPRLLSASGFNTLSLVPSAAEIFRARDAFTAFGFAERRFQADLTIEDWDGVWASAEWTLGEARRQRAALGRDSPAFIYTFVNAGHYPYDRDRLRRPDQVNVMPSSRVVERWANAIYYTSRAVEDHLEHVLAESPNALVIVLGDHRPPIGELLSASVPGATDPLAHSHSYATPLLVLDGGRIRQVGTLPAWHVPHLILDILSDQASCLGDSCPHRRPHRYRPIADRTLVVDDSGREVASCAYGDASPSCSSVQRETARLRGALVSLLTASRP